MRRMRRGRRPRVPRDPGRAREWQRRAEEDALGEVDRIRAPLFEELARRERSPDYYKGRPPHACCTRELNQMRISPLEAKAIARAFRRDRELRAKLPQVLERLRAELPVLRDTEERQSFDCPLLDGTRCLVHDLAKPIGCTAWHPPEPGEDARFTRRGWRAFRSRDELNDRVYGRSWKLRVIPLWLRRVFSRELGKAGSAAAGPARARRTAGPPGPRGGRRGAATPPGTTRARRAPGRAGPSAGGAARGRGR